MRFSCGQFSIELSSGWMDTTEDPWPFTLSKADGVGALQFSVAVYRSGQAPVPTVDDLSGLLSEFATTHNLGDSSEDFQQVGQITFIGSSFRPDADTFIRAWYLSDGFSIAKVTYTCHSSDVGSELDEAEFIVRSFQFSGVAPNNSFKPKPLRGSA
ncbi:hypothetical protein MUU75_12660 [Pseudoxanthomonas mexicana]|uniref:hypothetical protein n=1 Tax=Pseudoxanthomonas mexicana TaxID=128785 RepID=UPI001FD72373|nr:hypothetical protein [Pseudoxanthomonas mexicana]UOV04006.1 hypothetical protein MUU75_12660 [Pseudoxanthomonas mexicana]